MTVVIWRTWKYPFNCLNQCFCTRLVFTTEVVFVLFSESAIKLLEENDSESQQQHLNAVLVNHARVLW